MDKQQHVKNIEHRKLIAVVRLEREKDLIPDGRCYAERRGVGAGADDD